MKHGIYHKASQSFWYADMQCDRLMWIGTLRENMKLISSRKYLFRQTSVIITENCNVSVEYRWQTLDYSIKSNSLHPDQLILPSLESICLLSFIEFSKFTVHFTFSGSATLACIHTQIKKEINARNQWFQLLESCLYTLCPFRWM